MKYNAIAGFLAGLKPTPKISPSEWADNYRFLSPKSSAEPGRWRTKRTPYLREIMDRFSPYDICQEVVLMKGAQVGASEGGFNVMGFIVDIDPGPMMYVMPTIETVKKNSKVRIDPMIEATPVLRKKIKTARTREAGNTIFQKDFPNGVMCLVGANSAAGFRSLPIRVLILDEVDEYPQDVEGQGSPVKLAKARQRTFPRKKMFMLSTPAVQETSIILPEYEATTQRKYFVPCPHCGQMQHLKWAGLKWVENDPFSAVYECEGCREEIPEFYKTQMLEHGEWRDTVDKKGQTGEGRRVWGYHLNSLYSPLGWYSWADAVKDYLEAEAENSDTKRKVFQNTVLGLPWQQSGLVPEWKELYQRREGYDTNKPFKHVVFITAGVDVQGDRLEVQVLGWCRGKRAVSLDYRRIPGNTAETEVWNELEQMLNEVWIREDGAEMYLSKMAIDTGYNTQHVYTFCAKHPSSRVMPIKGNDNMITILSAATKVHKPRPGAKKTYGGLSFYNIGVSVIKSEIYSWLPLVPDDQGNEPFGYCRFPAYDEEYFKGLTAEKQVATTDRNNYTKWQWVKTYQRNEPLDTWVYARAAAAAMGMDKWKEHSWDAMDNIVTNSAPRSEKKAVKPQEKRGKGKREGGYW